MGSSGSRWRWRGFHGHANQPISDGFRGAEEEALELEQLLWYDTLAALAETTPCAEAPVPAARVQIEDEGVSTMAELLEDPHKGSEGVAEEDAPRLASLAFLHQYVRRDILEEEVLVRLLPDGSGSMRVLSAHLAQLDAADPVSEGDGRATKPRPRPRSIDDLFWDDADFRTPVPWATATTGTQEEDPLAQHELTSIFLLGESSGFLLAFHCLQAIDPCAV